MSSGYTDCACRDCFEIAISSDTTKPELCHECEEHGCSEDESGECLNPAAYDSAEECEEKIADLFAPEDLTVEMLVEALDNYDVEQWHGNCSILAHAAARLVGGKYAYGHYTGEVDPLGYWADTAGLPFQRHAWVRLPDGRVLDPTRWSFINEDPFIFVGEDIFDDYDEGGQAMRRSFRMPPPKDADNSDWVDFTVTARCAAHVSGLLDRDAVLDRINFAHAVWLASGPIDDLGPHVEEFYRFLVDNDWKMAIPIDHIRMILE